MHRSWILIFALALVSSGCTSKPESDATPKQSAQSKADAGVAGEVRLSPEQIKINGIQVVEVDEEAFSPTISAVGHVRARAGGEADVFPPFVGRLSGEKPLPKPGDSVAKGEMVGEVEQQFSASEKLQITSTSIQLQADIEQAQHEVDLKTAEQNRSQQLYDGGAIPLKQLQSAAFDVKQAQTKLEAARRSKQEYDAAQSSTGGTHRRVPIVAPISGIILTVDATLGQQVDPSKKILTLANLGTVWVEAAVHERDFSQVRSAKQAVIALPSLPGKALIGSLVTVGNVVDPQNRTIPMVFAVSNPNTVLKLEMLVEVGIPSAVAPGKSLVIPAAALLSDDTATAVYIEVQPGVYLPRSVEVGGRTADKVVVTAGLSKGEKVVTVGAQSLRSESRKGEIPVDDDDKEKDKGKGEKEK
jgi:membrane fusion protein, heavy metal efflux system